MKGYFYWSDDELLGHLRRLAARVAPKNLSTHDFKMLHVRGQPTLRTYFLRFGSWNEAKALAGLPLAEKNNGRVYSHFSEETCALAVRRCMDATGRQAYAAYEAWARTDPGAPCAATVRARCGSWERAKEQARAL